MTVEKNTEIKKYTVPAYIYEALQTLLPPQNKTVSQWAEENRILDSRSSDNPGKWKNSLTPYLVGIMDAFNDYEIEEIVFCKPTQVGGTEALQNMIGYIVTQDPSPTVIVYPSDTLAESVVANRIQPMLEDSPVLSKKYRELNSSKSELQFDDMYISIVGANSPSKLASRPAKYVFFDEIDKYPGATKKEADPISLGKERTKTFRGSKIFMTSTPTTKTGQIWRNLEDCDTEYHYFIPCPHCREMIELKFSNLRWEGKDTATDSNCRASSAAYYCQECGGKITDKEKSKMLALGKWQAVRSSSNFHRKVGFWLNTLYSPFTTFESIAREWMKGKDDIDIRHNFINSWLAEPWEDTKRKTSSDTVFQRQAQTEEFTVPDWAAFLTGGVDVQETCLYWTIRAWGKYWTSQNIAHGQALSFSEVAKIMNLSYRKEDGTLCIVQLALVDSGDQTDLVYNFTAENSEWAMPCKGVDSMLSHFRISTINKVDSKAYGLRLVLVDTGKYKDIISSRMQKENGTGSWMVYSGCDSEYAEQVTSEQKVIERNKNGREKATWVLKKTHGANHYLDTEVYAMAAADILGVRSLHLEEDTEEQEEQQPENAYNTKDDDNTNDWIKGGNIRI